ncbi:MAG: hypothetical protein JAZ15_03080 [Candidatus Thiodiazotropha endolucinida]|nr:hypothetical protein [Candidatus Thiodiazotropha taylori]MCW4311978.1 hypothetical protein [Candidatus Thiodiazotropha taylori]
MTFHKIGPNGNILDNFGIDTGMRLDRSGNILNRFGVTTFRSIDRFGNIVDGQGGLGPLTGLKLGQDGLVTHGGLPAALDGLSPFTGTRLGQNGLLTPGIENLQPSGLPNGIPSGRPRPTNPSDMSDNDWVRFVQRMKIDLNLYVCRHTRKHKGLFGGKWGCDRKRQPDDRCEENGSNKDKVVSYICESFGIDTDKASAVFSRLKEMGLIQVYKCQAVFFNDRV